MSRALDTTPVADAHWDDFDPAALARFRNEVGGLTPTSPLLELDDQALLLRLGAAVRRRDQAVPTMAGLLFFGRDPQQFFPTFTLTFLHFAGTDITPPRPDAPVYLDNREFRGRVPEMLDAARGALHAAMSRAAVVGPDLRRQARPEYPDVALREALLNAVAHRDYSREGSFIQVRLFADRLEVQSPGGLAGGVTVDNIRWEQYTRNPTICRLLEELGYVERRGMGVDLMIQAMSNVNLPLPEFQDRGTSFWVTLRAVPAAPAGDGALNERQQRVMEHLRAHGRITNREVVTLCEVSERTALYDLQEMVDRGVLLPIGSGRGRYYILRHEG